MTGVTYIATIRGVAKEQCRHISGERGTVLTRDTIAQLIVVEEFVGDLAQLRVQLRRVSMNCG